MKLCHRCYRFEHPGPCLPREAAFTAPVTEERAYRVSYTIDVDAESAQDAAEQVAALLSQPGVPQRGSYVVQECPGELVTVDLGEGEW
jgi:hypothetical protein